MSEDYTFPAYGAWAVGGGTMLGLGVGFFFLQRSGLAFVGCLLGGIGVGLIITAVLAAFGRR
jgi:hypothetical protein